MGPQPGHVCVQCAGELLVALASPGDVLVDFVLLQPGSWGRYKDLPVLRGAGEMLETMGMKVVRQGGTFAKSNWRNLRRAFSMAGVQVWTRPSAGAVWKDALVGGWGPFEMADFAMVVTHSRPKALGGEMVMTTTSNQSAADFADLVEYCWGNASTTWGKQRHKDGHPEPYRIRMFELGNEEYNENFVSQMHAMEERASQIGLGVDLFYFFPNNHGLNETDAAKLLQLGLPAQQVLPDIHVGAEGAIPDAENVFAMMPHFPQMAANCETNAKTHDMLRALQVVCDTMKHGDQLPAGVNGEHNDLQESDDLNHWLALFNQTTRSRLLVRTASFCSERSGHFDEWDQGLSFFLPNMTWLQPPGYVHKMMVEAWLPFAVEATPTGSAGNMTGQSWSTATDKRSSLTLRYTNMLGDSPRKVSITVDRLGCNASSTLQVHANVLTAANTSMANTPSEPALVAPGRVFLLIQLDVWGAANPSYLTSYLWAASLRLPTASLCFKLCAHRPPPPGANFQPHALRALSHALAQLVSSCKTKLRAPNPRWPPR
eukprot:scaffold133_cov407-Prasinococcus_capsulatus_cf.AAC.21